MNFTQWKAHAKKGAVSKVTYICGDQTVLRELVVQDIKDILQVPNTEYLSLEPTDAFWELASQYSLDANANRMIVIRDADKIEDWSGLETWLAFSRSNPNNYIVFVSNLSDAPSVYSRGKRVQYVNHIEVIRTKGKFIKCSQPNDDDLISWAESFGLTSNVASYLVERTSGDTSLMYNVLQKVYIWNGSPNVRVIDLLCNEQALDSFADYLILRQKPTAYLALQSMSQMDKDKIISRLDYRLDMLMEIARLARKRMYAGDIAATTGIKIYLVNRFLPIVKDYDEQKIRYCRQILSLVDGALRDGAKTGVWEVLITLW